MAFEHRLRNGRVRIIKTLPEPPVRNPDLYHDFKYHKFHRDRLAREAADGI